VPVAVDVLAMYWAGHEVACPDCEMPQRWRLTSEEDGAAWATCSTGHHLAHPLIYPEVVELAAQWTPATVTPEAHMRWHSALAGLHWHPHWRDEAGVHHGWESGPSTEFWQQRWPDLVAAQKHLDAVREWQASTRGTDLSFTWMSNWGTTEPDRTALEFVDFPQRGDPILGGHPPRI
jgi:hypothetical protein